jgi:pSer/pThr/pTyr-binding forkhead associated (FHA) protein
MTTTQAPSLHTPTDAASTVTLPVSDLEPVLDAFALLDHRAQRRAIKAGLAPSGQYLAIEDGEETLLLRLESRITHIGRSGACEIRFEDPRVSRDHAILVRHGRYARVLDNRSSNGTFLNGRPIVATNVRHGDVLRIGPIVLQYVEIP